MMQRQKNIQCKQLSSMVITYVKKMFAYALQNNRGDAEGLKSTLLAILPHAFGDHTHCCETWCGYLKSPATYRHRGLPHGNDLHCAETRRTIAELLGGLADQADKLAPLASSQANDSFNNTVASKAPKTRHYGGSESQDFRVAAAVLQVRIAALSQM